jgi:octaprenyl-diphosphate synthase
VGDLAKALIDDALAPVSDDLRTLNDRIVDFIPTETDSARRVLTHVFDGGGKRIRPALYFLCCRLLGYRGDHYYSIGAVAELVHTASLLHDDVVDDSTLRRNKPTANSIYGDETSVLVGDLIYSTASEMMAATGNMEIVKTFARAIRLMSDGELMQLENVFSARVAESTYLRILECKTAVLIGAACKSAALLAGSPADAIQRLECFGHSVGMAFQLIDDALDYTGAAEVVGKATLSDLPEGKVTMPVILLKERATPVELRRLDAILGSELIDASLVGEVARLVDKYDTAEATVERAHRYTHEAMTALHSFPASAQRDDLENLANKLLFRFN